MVRFHGISWERRVHQVSVMEGMVGLGSDSVMMVVLKMSIIGLDVIGLVAAIEAWYRVFVPLTYVLFFGVISNCVRMLLQ